MWLQSSTKCAHKVEDLAIGPNGGKEKTCTCYQKDGIETSAGPRAFTLVFIHDVNNFMHFLLELAVYSNSVCCVSILFSIPTSILAFLTSRMSSQKFWAWLLTSYELRKLSIVELSELFSKCTMLCTFNDVYYCLEIGLCTGSLCFLCLLQISRLR